jgi:hypothetical protein
VAIQVHFKISNPDSIRRYSNNRTKTGDWDSTSSAEDFFSGIEMTFGMISPVLKNDVEMSETAWWIRSAVAAMDSVFDFLTF